MWWFLLYSTCILGYAGGEMHFSVDNKVRFVCKTAKISLCWGQTSAMLQLSGSTQMVRKISHCCGNPVICSDTHHYIHRLSSIFVLDNHGVSAGVLQRNAFNGQTGEPALVQRHHVLEHERSEVSDATAARELFIYFISCACKSEPNIHSGFIDLDR